MPLDISKLMASIILSQLMSIIGSAIYGKFTDSWFLNLKKPKALLHGPTMLIARVIIATIMGILFYIIWISADSTNKNFLMTLMIILMITGILSPYFLLVKKSKILSGITLIISFAIGIIIWGSSYSISTSAIYLSLIFVIWILYLLVMTISTAIMNIEKTQKSSESK